MKTKIAYVVAFCGYVSLLLISTIPANSATQANNQTASYSIEP